MNTQLMPVDLHCHGVGKFNFTTKIRQPTFEIQKELERVSASAVMTFFIRRPELSAFENFAKEYSALKQAGKLANIVGLAIEGPLLASTGGTPEWASWFPTVEEWRRISNLGKHGVIYVVYSTCDNDEYCKDVSDSEIVKILLENNVVPALGHFSKKDPSSTADRIRVLLDLVRSLGRGPILTDHIFNDMPMLIKHAWRTDTEQRQREDDLRRMRLQDWNLDNLSDELGAVPAVLINGAAQGRLKLCMNFDGGHVDLDICKRTVDLVGAHNIFMMTDRIPGADFAGAKLTMREGSPLLYRDNGVVAGSSSSIALQISNMQKAGLCGEQIDEICSRAPREYLGRQFAGHVHP
jgi:N-acetylglucosamine-6-phosphate deacetylase